MSTAIDSYRGLKTAAAKARKSDASASSQRSLGSQRLVSDPEHGLAKLKQVVTETRLAGTQHGARVRRECVHN